MRVQSCSSRLLPLRAQSPPPEPEPSGLLDDAAPALAGFSLGAPSAYLGIRLADQYGATVARRIVEEAIPLVARGQLKPDTLIRLLPHLTNKSTQLQVGGFLFGLAGFAVGAALFWPTD